MTILNDNTKVILPSVIISVGIISIFLFLFPSVYFAKAPSENWWTALSIVVAISFGVIATTLTVWMKEKESKTKVESLEKKIQEYHKYYEENKALITSLISSVFDIPNISQTEAEKKWNEIKQNIDVLNNFGVLKPKTIRIWSEIAWRQGHINIALDLREKAYQLDNKDFRNRVMLCSILTQVPNPDSARIENILNNTDLESDNITNGDLDHFYNIKGTFYKKIGRFEEASDCFNKALARNIQEWPFNEYIITLIMRKDIDNKFIEKEIVRISRIPNSEWLYSRELFQTSFKLFVDGFLDKLKIDKFYSYLSPSVISKLTSKYNNEYEKMMFYHFYEQIEKKYNDSELNLLYLTFYKLLGEYDNQADYELEKQVVIDEIDKKLFYRYETLKI